MVRVGGKECFISVRVLTKIEICGWERETKGGRVHIQYVAS